MQAVVERVITAFTLKNSPSDEKADGDCRTPAGWPPTCWRITERISYSAHSLLAAADGVLLLAILIDKSIGGARYDLRLRLCANGLAFSRSVTRIGVPGRSKKPRRLLTR
ncbi:MAG: hypothetical protein K0Q64_204 [Nitrobacter vulgaris]|nr:hypothetical protein [Nitrobacter vulgaris]